MISWLTFFAVLDIMASRTFGSLRSQGSSIGTRVLCRRKMQSCNVRTAFFYDFLGLAY